MTISYDKKTLHFHTRYKPAQFSNDVGRVKRPERTEVKVYGKKGGRFRQIKVVNVDTTVPEYAVRQVARSYTGRSPAQYIKHNGLGEVWQALGVDDAE